MEESGNTTKKSSIVPIVIGIVLALVVIGGIVLVAAGSQKDEPKSVDSATHSEDDHSHSSDMPSDDCVDETGKSEATLIYDSSENFVPECIKISSGTTVTYRNDSDFSLDVGADPHPSHTGNREVSKKDFELPVEPNGGTASTVMDKVGNFGLHNHANASATATIIVE